MRIPALLIILPFILALRSHAADASAIFAQTGPSVVLIKNEEGIGSGVVIRQDGLILTNFHVANSPLPLTVEAEVMEQGKRVRKEFPNVRLHRIHKDSDLALLQIPPGAARFAPAKLARAETDAKAGVTCYALGYPYLEGQEKPELVITKGIINSASRMVSGLKYLQLDAAINPGNSGGALVNEQGVLIGIPTLRYEGAEKIGLATPVAGLRMEDFIELKDRKGNVEEAQRLSDVASLYLTRNALSLGGDDESLIAALILLREAQFLDPSNPKRAIQLAQLYWQARELKISRAYAEQAIKLAPKNLEALILHAAVCLQSDDNNAANKSFLSGAAALADDTDPKRREAYFTAATPYFSKNGDAVRALYLLAWRQSEFPNQGGVETDMIIGRVSALLPENVVRTILAKKSDFSVAEMDRLVKAHPPDPKKVADAKPVAPADITKVKELSVENCAIRMQIPIEPGLNAKLVDAPEGVTYDPASGMAEWRFPRYASRKEARMLFLITRNDGSEETQVHVMRRE